MLGARSRTSVLMNISSRCAVCGKRACTHAAVYTALYTRIDSAFIQQPAHGSEIHAGEPLLASPARRAVQHEKEYTHTGAPGTWLLHSNDDISHVALSRHSPHVFKSRHQSAAGSQASRRQVQSNDCWLQRVGVLRHGRQETPAQDVPAASRHCRTPGAHFLSRV